MNEPKPKYEINVNVEKAVGKEIAKTFRQSAMFDDWFRVLNDEWMLHGLGIIISDDQIYLLDKQNTEKSMHHFSLFADAYREGLKLYVERVKASKTDE